MLQIPDSRVIKHFLPRQEGRGLGWHIEEIWDQGQ